MSKKKICPAQAERFEKMEIYDTEEIPLEQIKIDNRFTTRTSYDYKQDEDFEGLKISIKKVGLLQPIGVYPLAYKEYVLIFGLRRYLAVQQLGKKKILASIFIA